MKKLLGIFALTASAAMLQADYYGSSGCEDYYPQEQQGQYMQGQYMQQQPQGQYPQRQQYAQGQNSQGQYQQSYGQNPSQRGYGQDPSQQGYDQGPYQQGQRQYSQGSDQKSDQELQSDIQDSLRSIFTDKYNNVNATVQNGNVTLTGAVRSEDDKKDLEEKIRDMDGVKNVNNQVTVQENLTTQPREDVRSNKNSY